jgi:DNA-binding response OmpR family regulator
MNFQRNPKTQHAPLSILFADDDADDQFFFREALLEIDPSIQLDVAKNAEELLNMLRHKAPGIIFLNLHLPGKDAFKCLQEIKSNSRLQHTSVVMLSSFRRPADEQASYRLGADLFFVKPFSYTELKSGIKDVLRFDWKDSKKQNGTGGPSDSGSCASGTSPFPERIFFQPANRAKTVQMQTIPFSELIAGYSSSFESIIRIYKNALAT